RRGHAKILDFGLAKVTAKVAAGHAESETGLATSDSHLTSPGVMLGTVAYMSPEQIRAKEADARSDLFSFGAVLYEMATGKLPFRGDSSGEICGAILHKEPVPPAQLNAQILPGLEAVVLKALEKDRELRYQHAADMRADLQRLKRDTDTGRIATADSGSTRASGPRLKISSAAIRGDGSSSAKAAVAEAAVVRRKKRGVILTLIAVLVIAGLIAAGLYYRSHQRRKLTEKDTIVVADFDNKTGDKVFDDTLKTALTVALNQSPFLNVLADNKVAATLKLMTRPVDTRLTPDVARALCMRAGSAAYVAGSIASLGSEYVIGLKAVSCRTDDTLAQEQVTVLSKEKVLNAVGDAAAKLRGLLGESLASVQKFDVPLPEATTSSLDALQAFSTGLRIDRTKGPAAAIEYHQHAIQLDPNFALAYRYLAGDYYNLAELGRAREYFTKAFELRAHASEREKLLITASYYFTVTGELDKAAQAYQQMIDNFPRYLPGYGNFGVVECLQGDYENALNLAHQARQLEPDRFDGYGIIANSAMALQRFDEARKAFQESQARKLDDFIVRNALYGLAFLESDSQAMGTQQRWYAENPDLANFGLSLDSDSEAYRGHIGKARELTKSAAESAVRVDSRETGAIWWENAALREAAIGNPADARKDAESGLKLYPASQSVQIEAGLAYSMVGDTVRAQTLGRELNQQYPHDTQLQSLWLPAINAELALNRRNPGDAIEQLQSARPSIEYGSTAFIAQISCLYPTFIRGEAYLTAGQGKEAAAEFQKILDHRGMVWNCWTGALARLGMARANALEMKTLTAADADAARFRALAAYKDFLGLWKDADPETPIYKQAKAEYAKLQ
ncbi:MAG: protein kinase, partial [Acidobacteriaceae bacterium]|nr:protein kinase [Acidobacteriaceae bacterium]